MPKRVIVALSGGVDSSVALLKVLEAGYEAVGVTLKLWAYRDASDYPPAGGTAENKCCTSEAVSGARDLCLSLGVPHYLLDFRDAFRSTVVDYFVAEYLAGRTPNPCVQCNSCFRWNALLDQADQLDAEKIATGHYACIETGPDGQPRLLKGVDRGKNQSYVLWGIPRAALARTLLPLGGMSKSQVRQMARDHGLAAAETPESQEICFVTDDNYRRFLGEYANGRPAEVGEGEIVDEAGQVVGRHPGYVNFTIGQRRGLGIAHREPLYVKSLDPAANRVTVAPRSSLFGSICEVGSLNWLVDPPAAPVPVHAQVRYNSTGASARLIPAGETVRLEFDEPQLAITPGQSAVFYTGDVLMGGGVIRGEAST